MPVYYGAARFAAGPWSTAMSSVYAESKCLPCVDCNLTSLCVNRVFCMIRFLDGGLSILRRRREDLGCFWRWLMPCLIFFSRHCVLAFTSFLRRYLQSILLMRIASIPKVRLALTRLLLKELARICWFWRVPSWDESVSDSVLVRCSATTILWLSNERRPGCDRGKPRLARCIFHCGKWPFLSHFAMFVTCFCTVRLSFLDVILTCLAFRCIPTRTRRQDFHGSKKCCGGSPATPCFSHYFNHGHLQWGPWRWESLIRLPIFSYYLVGS